MSRSAFAFHFISPVEIIDAMKQAGFSDIQVFQPAFENSNSVGNSDAENQKTKHLGDLVWVIEAKA